MKTIHSTSELKRIIYRINSNTKVNLQLPFLTMSENAAWTLKLRNYGDNCGCDAGGLGGMAGMLSYLIFIGINYSSLFEQPSYYVLRGFIYVLLCSLLAKAASILRHRYLRYRDYKSICLSSEKINMDDQLLF